MTQRDESDILAGRRRAGTSAHTAGGVPDRTSTRAPANRGGSVIGPYSEDGRVPAIYEPPEDVSDVWVASVVDRRGEAGRVTGVFSTEAAALEWRRNHHLQLMEWELVVVEAFVLNEPDYGALELDDPLYVQPRASGSGS